MQARSHIHTQPVAKVGVTALMNKGMFRMRYSEKEGICSTVKALFDVTQITVLSKKNPAHLASPE